MTARLAHPTHPARRRFAPAVIVAALLAVAGLVSACGGGGESAGTRGAGGQTAGAGGSSSGSVNGNITVLAAASLTESFTAIGKEFEAAHPGTRVTFSFGPSSGLAEQIRQGAPADVFASASPTNMQQVVDAGDVAAPQDFARNVLQIAVPADNPAGVASIADLAKPGLKLALCQPQVPCGALAAKLLTSAHLTVTPVSAEKDVKAVLTKVRLGEVDAGLVYVTDVRAAGAAVRGITVPADVNASTTYPIATVRTSANSATARAFVDYVLSAAGRSALTAAGFEPPKAGS